MRPGAQIVTDKGAAPGRRNRACRPTSTPPAPTCTQTQARLAAVEASLADIRRAVDADVVLAMPLLAVDGAGLTVSGGALGFISTADTPVLFDSALGRLALYVRDTHDQCLVVAYYDHTAGQGSVWTVPAAAGVMAFVARSTDPVRSTTSRCWSTPSQFPRASRRAP